MSTGEHDRIGAEFSDKPKNTRKSENNLPTISKESYRDDLSIVRDDPFENLSQEFQRFAMTPPTEQLSDIDHLSSFTDLRSHQQFNRQITTKILPLTSGPGATNANQKPDQHANTGLQTDNRQHPASGSFASRRPTLRVNLHILKLHPNGYRCNHDLLGFETVAQARTSGGSQSNSKLTIALMDIGHFKRLNNT